MRKGATTMGTGESPPPNFWDPSNGVQISENENVRVFTAFHPAKNSAALQPDRPNPRTLGRLETSVIYNFCPLPSYLRRGRAPGCIDYVSTCGVSLMPVVYQVVGFGRDDGSHSGRHGRRQRSVIREG